MNLLTLHNLVILVPLTRNEDQISPARQFHRLLKGLLAGHNLGNALPWKTNFVNARKNLFNDGLGVFRHA